MKVIADEQRRVTLPTPVRAGDIFELEAQPSGRMVLTKLAPGRPQPKLVKKDGMLLLSSEEPITWEQTRKAMDEYP